MAEGGGPLKAFPFTNTVHDLRLRPSGLPTAVGHSGSPRVDTRATPPPSWTGRHISVDIGDTTLVSVSSLAMSSVSGCRPREKFPFPLISLRSDAKRAPPTARWWRSDSVAGARSWVHRHFLGLEPTS